MRPFAHGARRHALEEEEVVVGEKRETQPTQLLHPVSHTGPDPGESCPGAGHPTRSHLPGLICWSRPVGDRRGKYAQNHRMGGDPWVPQPPPPSCLIPIQAEYRPLTGARRFPRPRRVETRARAVRARPMPGPGPIGSSRCRGSAGVEARARPSLSAPVPEILEWRHVLGVDDEVLVPLFVGVHVR